MSIEQRELIKKLFELSVKGLFVVLGWFLVNSFLEVKADIKEIKSDIRQELKEVKRDMSRIDNRLIKVETKLEK